MKIVLAIALGLLLLLPATGCGGSDESSTSDLDQRAKEAEEEVNAPVEAYAGSWAGLKQAAGRYADQLLIPSGLSPDEVVIRDLKIGSGPAITPGDTFGARYVSFDYETGKRVERNWGRDPWRLKWKIGELVDGWEPGLKGIRPGGMRELIVPSRLAYEEGPRVYIVEAAEIEPD